MICLVLLGVPATTRAAAPSKPTVKDVALAFGNALVHNDGGMAISLLAPDLRRHTAPNQLPTILNVSSPPRSVHVVRWEYSGRQGDATLSLIYPGNKQIAEQLLMQLYAEGWRITSIEPQDALSLQRAAETTVVAFCDAAARQDAATMRQQLTTKLADHRSDKDLMKLLKLPGPLDGYTVQSYMGTPAGATIAMNLQSGNATIRDEFAVINDRDGWRIASIAPVS
jgi:hypothetical protein